MCQTRGKEKNGNSVRADVDGVYTPDVCCLVQENQFWCEGGCNVNKDRKGYGQKYKFSHRFLKLWSRIWWMSIN